MKDETEMSAPMLGSPCPRDAMLRWTVAVLVAVVASQVASIAVSGWGARKLLAEVREWRVILQDAAKARERLEEIESSTRQRHE